MNTHSELATQIADILIAKGLIDPANHTRDEVQTLLLDLLKDMPGVKASYATGYNEGVETAAYFKGLGDGMQIK
jgi:hypothetical protein